MERPLQTNQSIARKKALLTWIPFPRSTLRVGAVVLLGLLLLQSSRVAAQVSALETEASQNAAQSAGAKASKDRILFIRPHAGVGWASAYNRAGNALALHAGGRLLFPSPLSPNVDAKFGVEATYVQLDIAGSDIFSERYAAVGIVLEMTVVKGFNLGVGTLGYIGVGGTERNPFGVVTNLGWEPLWESRARPYITMRSEWVFDRATYSVLSLSAGITFGI